MNDLITDEYWDFIKNGELGYNAQILISVVEGTPDNGILVDIGVETGKSSKLLLHNSIAKKSKVYGIDPIPTVSIPGILDHPNYQFIKADSVTTGKNWDKGQVDVVFVDSIHAKEQVLMELYYWWDLVKEKGWIAFHDTEWHNYIHKPGHPCAGKKPGNSGLGYDFYQGIAWETPDKAVMEFFKIEKLSNDPIKDTHFENEFIFCHHMPESLGMTFIKKKKHFDFKSLIHNWQEIESNRQILLKSFI
jgi:hypothetical protein